MKNEQELIKLRQKFAKKIHVWNPDTKEFFDEVVAVQWTRLLEDIDRRDLAGTVRVIVGPYCQSKYYDGLLYLYGQYHGNQRPGAIILLYMHDILTVNLWQKNLVNEHVYFILQHELNHHFGLTHEDMDHIGEFGYPGEHKS